MIAVLRKGAELGGPGRGAHAIGEKRPQLIEDATRMAEAVELEMIQASPMTCDPYRFCKACAIAADRLEGLA